MTWKLGSTAVGDLEYQYDADSRVIQKTGSFAQTKLPVPVTGNTFNAANEMTAFNGTPQTYDPNGNLRTTVRTHTVGMRATISRRSQVRAVRRSPTTLSADAT